MEVLYLAGALSKNFLEGSIPLRAAEKINILTIPHNYHKKLYR